MVDQRYIHQATEPLTHWTDWTCARSGKSEFPFLRASLVKSTLLRVILPTSQPNTFLLGPDPGGIYPDRQYLLACSVYHGKNFSPGQWAAARTSTPDNSDMSRRQGGLDLTRRAFHTDLRNAQSRKSTQSERRRRRWVSRWLYGMIHHRRIQQKYDGLRVPGWATFSSWFCFPTLGLSMVGSFYAYMVKDRLKIWQSRLYSFEQEKQSPIDLCTRILL